jgi:hypothetical protein
MKQIWPTYAYSPTTNVLTLTGLNIDRDQLLLVTAADRGRIMYNFADSSVTASAFTSGANTALTLVATTAGLTTTAALVIYFDDQATSSTVTGTVELGPTSLNALESITVTMGQVTVTGGLTDVQLRASAVTVGGTVTVGNSLTISSLPAISGTVTVGNTVTIAGTVTANPTGTQTIAGTVTLGLGTQRIGSVTAFGRRTNYTTGIEIPIVQQGDAAGGYGYNDNPFIPIRIITNQTGGASDFVGNETGGNLPISGTVTVGNSVTIASLPALVAGTAQIGVVTIGNIRRAGDAVLSQLTTEAGSGYLLTKSTLHAGSEQIGSVTASISNSVTIASLPAISGTVTANTFALQGTAVTTSNFTSTTASTVLANYNATREVLTIFNEGAGNLHIAPGATCTTIAYQVRLSAGDYYEAPSHQTTITHSAVFATAGTARVTEVS